MPKTRNGASDCAIMRQIGHRSVQMFGAAFAKANSSTTTPRLKLGCSAGTGADFADGIPVTPAPYRPHRRSTRKLPHQLLIEHLLIPTCAKHIFPRVFPRVPSARGRVLRPNVVRANKLRFPPAVP